MCGIILHMYLEEISLENFRNYHSKTLHFSTSGSFLCGENGSGKTNLLESIYLLAYGKSFRTSNAEELLMFSKQHFSVTGTFNGSMKKRIEFRFSGGERKIVVNGVEISSLRELIGNVALILLSLNDINLVMGNPALRRHYLDAVLALLHLDYLSDLLDYRRILRQRNKLLYLFKIGKRASVDGIEGWTEELVQVGSRIIEKRFSIMDEVDACTAHYYDLFASSGDKLAITYRPSMELNGSVAESFHAGLKKCLRSEMERGITLVGPHRDDLHIVLNGVPARKFASEGEQRTGAISLKLAQAAFLKKRMKNDPILLVDEAVAELDRTRKGKVLQQVTEIGQCFIATTNCETLKSMTELKTVEVSSNEHPEELLRKP
jgi:DNA replication and repair protein RecF